MLLLQYLWNVLTASWYLFYELGNVIWGSGAGIFGGARSVELNSPDISVSVDSFFDCFYVIMGITSPLLNFLRSPFRYIGFFILSVLSFMYIPVLFFWKFLIFFLGVPANTHTIITVPFTFCIQIGYLKVTYIIIFGCLVIRIGTHRY